ncbi:hypothetical protein PRIPAC_97648 [Pristionchus pacificus]|uniref:Uncharacterized protein n=1 Tax=Pristionchus pacificus TaxID=54126 RepID=A0A454Y028_PRIPA|nr:hypothetical protein PRIPAC_97648 [Pristionchus pacificus]|eukprot:PDM60149.1 hypothetical protein PRIPAC_53974 [Pristionchus pacificus]
MSVKLAHLLIFSLIVASCVALTEWELHQPMRMCGKKLLQFVMDHDLCRPDKCDGKKPIFTRFRRGAETTVLTKACCDSYCKPYRIAEICCS